MAGDLDVIYAELESLLRGAAAGLAATDVIDGSTAKSKKPAIHLYGKKEVSIGDGPKRRVCFASVIRQKNHVGFYFMPYYGAPDKFPLSPALRKALSGKACFNFKANPLPPELKEELSAMLRQGKAAFRKNGWI